MAPGRPLRWVAGGGALLLAPVVYLVALNAFANLALPGLLSRHPERLQVGWSFVWMWVPGRVAVLRDLDVRGQGPGSRWSVTAERVEGSVDLWALADHRFTAADLVADGVRVRYRRRGGEPAPDAATRAPPIDGFETLPDPPPGPSDRRPWPLSLSLSALGLNELWVDDYRYQGHAPLSGTASLGDTLDVALNARFDGGEVTSGDARILSRIEGPLDLRVDGLPRDAELGRAAFTHVSGTSGLATEIENLSFLEQYLARAPWLSLVGTGHLRTDLSLAAGTFRPGSALDARTRDLTVRFLSYDIRGDGVVHLEAVDAGGVPESHLSVAFGAYTIGEAGQPALVEGNGFTVTGTSPDVSIALPFTTLALVLDLPESRVPNVPLFNAFLPSGTGLALTGGTGTVRGRLSASTVDSIATGQAVITGRDVTARFDDLSLLFDFTMLAPLRQARLDQGIYDFSGASVALRRFALADAAAPEKGPKWDADRDWWATVSVPSGRALVGRPEYLDAKVTLEAADSAPFVRMVSQKKELPGWLQKALDLPAVGGSGRVTLGTDSIRLEPMMLSAGKYYEVGLRWLRRGQATDGALFAAYQNLSVGFRFAGDEREVVPFNARAWFASLGAPVVAADTEAPGRPGTVIRWRKRERD